MKKKLLPVSMAILAMTTTGAFAQNCAKEQHEAVVSGTVTTQSVSETMQVGTISMQMTTVEKGKVVFDETGALIGQITGQSMDEFGRPVSFLNHVIVFEDGSTIETNGDVATLVDDYNQCDPRVEEVISDFWGTKTFKKSTGTINADGRINFCTGENQFELSGTISIKG